MASAMTTKARSAQKKGDVTRKTIFPFLDLPLELRIMIYELIMNYESSKFPHSHHCVKDEQTQCRLWYISL